MKIEIGIAVSEITVVRKFKRNAKRITATTAAASNSTCSSVEIEVSMNFFCSKTI